MLKIRTILFFHASNLSCGILCLSRFSTLLQKACRKKQENLECCLTQMVSSSTKVLIPFVGVFLFFLSGVYTHSQ